MPSRLLASALPVCGLSCPLSTPCSMRPAWCWILLTKPASGSWPQFMGFGPHPIGGAHCDPGGWMLSHAPDWFELQGDAFAEFPLELSGRLTLLRRFRLLIRDMV